MKAVKREVVELSEAVESGGRNAYRGPNRSSYHMWLELRWPLN